MGFEVFRRRVLNVLESQSVEVEAGVEEMVILMMD